MLSELEEPIRDPMPPALAVEVLVVGADDWAIRRAAAELTGAGRRVHRCHDSAETPFPCNALIPGRGCPLDTHHVDVVIDVRARANSELSMGEMGAICGLRAGLPLVLAGLSEAAPLEHWAATVPADGDIVTSCDEAMRDATDFVEHAPETAMQMVPPVKPTVRERV